VKLNNVRVVWLHIQGIEIMSNLTTVHEFCLIFQMLSCP